MAAVFEPPYGFADASAASADVGTVKSPVYTASPLTNLKLVMYPTQAALVAGVLVLPI